MNNFCTKEKNVKHDNFEPKIIDSPQIDILKCEKNTGSSKALNK